MDENLEQLKHISLIAEVQPLKLRTENRGVFTSAEAWDRALIKQEQISAYRFVYKSNDHNVIGYIVKPKHIDKSKLPAIIYNRGGNGDFGKITLSLIYGDLANLAKQDYIVIASQYSGVEGGEGKDEFGGKELEDVLVLKDILSSYPQANANSVGMIGYSRGGMMTYLVLRKVDWIKAAVVVAGPTNLIRSEELRPEMANVHKRRFGGNREELIKRSALYWPEELSKKTPLLIMHGTADERVSVLDSIELAAKLKSENVQYELKIFEGADHGLTQFNKEYHQMIYSWFEKYLKED